MTDYFIINVFQTQMTNEQINQIVFFFFTSKQIVSL